MGQWVLASGDLHVVDGLQDGHAILLLRLFEVLLNTHARSCERRNDDESVNGECVAD